MHSLRRIPWCAVPLVTFLSVSAPAHAESDPIPYPACDREPSDSDTQAAKGAFSAGEVSFQEADYSRALLYWEDAFRRDCKAVKLLLNLARAYELSDRPKRSVLALETYLERRPDDEDREAIEKRIARLRRTIEAEEHEASTVGASEQPEAEPETKTAEPAGADSPAASPKKPIWPVLVTGGGVLALGAGIPLWIAGQNEFDAVLSRWAESGCTPEDCPSNLQPNANAEARDAKSLRATGITLTVVGGVAAAAGAVFWTLVWRDTSPSALTELRPLVAPGTVGLTYSGQF